MIVVEVVLHYFHGLELFEASFLCNFVFAVVRIVFQVSDVGDIAHIANFVPKVAQVAQYDIKSYSGAGVSQVSIAVHCRAADVHTHERSVQGLEGLLAAAHRVVDAQVVGAYARNVGTHRIQAVNPVFSGVLFLGMMRSMSPKVLSYLAMLSRSANSRFLAFSGVIMTRVCTFACCILGATAIKSR